MERNLKAYEIFDQVALLNRHIIQETGTPITNIVYMGMGEPLLNFRQVMDSIEWITGTHGLGMSPKRITVSTAGIAKIIKQMGDAQVKFEFALSLHAANDHKRSQLMPINDTNNLSTLLDALMYFYQKTRTRTTLEYTLLENFNDTKEDAFELAFFSRKFPSKVNLIEYNPIAEAGYQPSSGNRLQKFKEILESQNVIVNVRRSRGKDINGACGQLALKVAGAKIEIKP